MFRTLLFAVVAIAVLAVDHQMSKHGGAGMPRWLMAVILGPLGLWARLGSGDDGDEPMGRGVRMVFLPLAGGFCFWLASVGWATRDSFVLGPLLVLMAPVGLVLFLWWLVELLRGTD